MSTASQHKITRYGQLLQPHAQMSQKQLHGKCATVTLDPEAPCQMPAIRQQANTTSSRAGKNSSSPIHSANSLRKPSKIQPPKNAHSKEPSLRPAAEKKQHHEQKQAGNQYTKYHRSFPCVA